MVSVLSFLGWFFIPKLATASILTVYYRLKYTKRSEEPPRGSPQNKRDGKIVYTLVICAYLAYSLIRVYREVLVKEIPYYEILGLRPNASSKEIKKEFRKLSLQLHPDKVGIEGHDYWLGIKSMFDVLSDPSKRMAYDRFGDQMLKWVQKEASLKMNEESGVSLVGIIQRGLKEAVMGYYLASFGVLVVLSLCGWDKVGREWKYFTLVVGLVFEVAVITGAYKGYAVQIFLPYQAIQLCRNLIIISQVAIGRLGPLVRDGPVEDDATLSQLTQLVEKKVSRISTLSANLLDDDLAPFEQNEGMINGIRTTMGKKFVESIHFNDPEVIDALETAEKEGAIRTSSGSGLRARNTGEQEDQK